MANLLHLVVLRLHVNHGAQRVEDAALLVAPTQQHLGDCFEAVTLQRHLLGAHEARQIQNDTAAQLNDVLVHLRPDGLRHDGVAEIGNELGVGDQRLRYLSRYTDYIHDLV